jgi:hypothetical protein
VDLDQLEAEFWSRPGEQVHADLQSPLNWPIAAAVAAHQKGRLSRKQEAELLRSVKPFRLPSNERQRVQTVERALASHSDVEREFVSRLPFRVVERWVLAPPDQRGPATDWIVAYAIHAFGPEVFYRPAVQAHLTALWRVMHSAPSVAERTAAKERWRYIMRASLPNLRAFKEPWNPIDAAGATQKSTEALRRLTPRRKRRWHTKDLDELTRQLTAIFADWRWPTRILKKLADGIIDRHSDTIRAMIQAGVGHSLGRGHPGIRDTLAAASRRAKRQRRREDIVARIVAGKRQYVEWLTREGFEPHPAVLARLKNPPTIS